jgi:hypothetical protein
LVRYISEDPEDFLTIQEPPPTAHLALLVEGRVSHSFPLRGQVQLGREKDNTIVVADQKVSRHHAVLEPTDDTYVIRDQGSANGTFVNSVRIGQPTRLHHNDKVRLGDTTFLFTASRPELVTLSEAIPSGAVASPSPSQPLLQNSIPVFSSNNTPIWLVIGCMAVAILALLVILALMFGWFLGRGGQVGLMLGWVTIMG